MALVKLGKKGQVSIPQALLKALKIPADSPLIVEATPDGAIVLRQAVVYPVEIYSDGRVAEFERENALPAKTVARAQRVLGRRRKRRR